MMRSIGAIFFLFMIAAGCDSIREDNGGGCRYDSLKFQAVILPYEMDSADMLGHKNHLKISVIGKQYPDSNLLYKNLNHKLCPPYLKNHGIKPGETISGTAQFITKGHCSPAVYRFDRKDLNGY